jgi:glycosyltransferase involved in cell wall biosynthesis
MNLLFHVTFPPPPMPESVAELQEIRTLRKRFGGDLIYLNPNQHSPVRLPRLVFGFHRIRELRRRDKNIELHHVYNPDPYPFPVLRFLRRPIVYSISGGVGTRRPDTRFFNSLAAVLVADDHSQNQLTAWGVENVARVRAGIDTSRFSCTPLPLHSTIRLMVGSAPWTPAQFQTKGVNALLSAAQRNRRLQLVFLWRGILKDQMLHQVQQMDLAQQVTVLGGQMDVNEILAGVHGSITLATAPGIVKSYPHSLIESLAAGKPVLVSRSVPMAAYVEKTGCGKVIERVTPSEILAAVESLAAEYDALKSVAQQVGQRDFSLQAMLSSFESVYAHALGQPIFDDG